MNISDWWYSKVTYIWGDSLHEYLQDLFKYIIYFKFCELLFGAKIRYQSLYRFISYDLMSQYMSINDKKKDIIRKLKWSWDRSLNDHKRILELENDFINMIFFFNQFSFWKYSFFDILTISNHIVMRHVNIYYLKWDTSSILWKSEKHVYLY